MTSLDLTTRMYLGLPKPGHAVFEGRIDAGRTGPMLLRSRFFARYLGSECIGVPSAGVTRVKGRLEPRPIAVLTDLLQHDATKPAGLVVEGPGEPAWVGATRLLMGALEKQGVVTLLPADQHLNPDLLDRGAATSFTVVEDLLFDNEKARLRASPQLAAKVSSTTPLTVAEYETLFGNVVDKEDRNFLPHCREGVVEYIPSVLSWLGRQRAAVMQQLDSGVPVATATVLPDFKTGLSCLSAPDSRGLHGNALRDALMATQRGLYLDGPARPHAKLAIVGGTAHEYSVAELIRFLVDMDYSVVWLLSCTGGLGIAAKLATAMDLSERYGTRLFCTYGWPLPAHLGAEPRGYALLAAKVEAEDRAELESLEKERVRLVQQRVTTQGRPVVVAADVVEKARETP